MKKTLTLDTMDTCLKKIKLSHESLCERVHVLEIRFNEKQKELEQLKCEYDLLNAVAKELEKENEEWERKCCKLERKISGVSQEWSDDKLYKLFDNGHRTEKSIKLYVYFAKKILEKFSSLEGVTKEKFYRVFGNTNNITVFNILKEVVS